MASERPIYLFTDYGVTGPYVGQLHAAIYRQGYNGRVVDLQHDAPAFDPVASGILLAALMAYLPEEAVVLAVIDPGVGSDRAALRLKMGGRCLIGPDNGLFACLFDQIDEVARIDWMPESLSYSFHGRDWFAPVASRVAQGKPVEQTPVALDDCVGFSLVPRLEQVIYCDAFGNAMTGLPAVNLSPAAVLGVGAVELRRAGTFHEVPEGQAFWYENSLGLVEIAVNRGSAAQQLGLSPGDRVLILD